MSKENKNINGMFSWLDSLLGGYFGLAVALVVGWIFIIFPIALIVWIVDDVIPWIMNQLGG